MPNQPADKETINSLEDPPKTPPKDIAKTSKNDFVLDPFENLTLELSTSCTKEDAVAKMLGWLRGPLRIDPDSLNIHNISLKMMPFLPKLYYSLEDHLMMLREDAVELLAEANESNITEAVDELNKCEELIMDANVYMCGIDDELLKGAASALRIDQVKTENTGELYITLKSLDEWSQQNYKITIIDTDAPSHWNIVDISQLVTKQAQEGTTNAGLSRTKADNLYTTFAFMVEAFAKKSSLYQIGDDKLNVDAISKAIEKLATEANMGNELKGQSYETIKSVIEIARKTKRQKLPIK